MNSIKLIFSPSFVYGVNNLYTNRLLGNLTKQVRLLSWQNDVSCSTGKTKLQTKSKRSLFADYREHLRSQDCSIRFPGYVAVS